MKKIYPLILLSMLFGCSKDGAEESVLGTVSFWAAEDLGVGNIQVMLDGEAVGTISHFYPGGIICGSTDVNIQKPGGTYQWTAQGNNSTTWSGNIYFENGVCNTIRLLPNGGSNTGNPPTVTTPSTQFIAHQDYSVSNIGAYFTHQFTVNTTSTFHFRFTSKYSAQAAIITPDQLSNFTSQAAFTGYGVFNNQTGTNVITLSPGDYYVGVRNTYNGANVWSTELDKSISLPPSDRSTFYDYFINDAKNWTSPMRYWQGFSIQNGYRYFLDGCNINCDIWIIGEDQLAAFQNGQTFQYYSQYHDPGGQAPGFWEIQLNPGNYYLVSSNTERASLAYVMERWRVD